MKQPDKSIEPRILSIRHQKVMLDADLATLYEVSTKRFNEQVRRNLERFPCDFMFQLTQPEWDVLRSQIATLKAGRGQHRKYLPYVFTEHGAIMAANVINSSRAVEMGIHVVRSFIRLRELMASNNAIAQKLKEVERKLGSHDKAIQDILNSLRQLMAPPTTKKRGIGFIVEE